MQRHAYEIVCPHCLETLIDKMDILECISCDKTYPRYFGIPCFDTALNNEGTLSSKSLDGEKKNYAQKLYSVKSLPEKRNNDSQKLYRWNSVFQLALLIPRKTRLLVAENSISNMSLELLREFKEVYAFDHSLYSLKTFSEQCAENHIENLTAVQGNTCSLPFPDMYFDGIVVDDFVGMGNMPISNRQLEKRREQILKEFNRVLQPNGVLCMNSVEQYKPWKGRQRDFWQLFPSDNEFTIFSRTINNIRSLKRGVLSRDIWSKIFRQAGFNQLKWFSAYPGSIWYRYVVSLGNIGALMFVFKTLISGHTNMLGRLSKIACRFISLNPIFVKAFLFFSPSFIVFASRKGKLKLGLKSGNDVVSVWDSGDDELAVTVNERRVSLYLVEGKRGDFKKKYTLPINQRAEDKIRMAHMSVDLIRKKCPSLDRSLPNSIIHSRNKGIFDCTSAVMGSPINVTDSESLKSFSSFLLKLNDLSLEQSDIETIPAEFDIRDTLSMIAEENKFGGEILQILRRAQIIHGDLNRGNILVDSTHKTMAGLIDFEHAKIAPNVLNWYDFLLRNFVLYGRNLPIDSTVVLKRCRKLPGHIQSVPLLNTLTRDFLRSCKINAFLHSQFVILYAVYLCQDPIVRDIEIVVEGIKAMNLTV